MLAINMCGYCLKNTHFTSEETKDGIKEVFKFIVIANNIQENKLIKVKVKAYDSMAKLCYANIIEGTKVEITGYLSSNEKNDLYVVAEMISFKNPNEKKLMNITKNEILNKFNPKSIISELEDLDKHFRK